MKLKGFLAKNYDSWVDKIVRAMIYAILFMIVLVVILPIMHIISCCRRYYSGKSHDISGFFYTGFLSGNFQPPGSYHGFLEFSLLCDAWTGNFGSDDYCSGLSAFERGYAR